MEKSGEKVSGILFDSELDALRVCVVRRRDFGSLEWLTRTSKRLGIETTLRPRGRPQKKRSESARQKKIPDTFSRGPPFPGALIFGWPHGGMPTVRGTKMGIALPFSTPSFAESVRLVNHGKAESSNRKASVVPFPIVESQNTTHRTANLSRSRFESDSSHCY